MFSVYDAPPGTLTVENIVYDAKISAYSIGIGGNIYFDLTTRRGFNQVLGFQINLGSYTIVVDRKRDQKKPEFEETLIEQLNQIYYGIDYIQRLYGFYGKVGINDGHAFAFPKGPTRAIGGNINLTGSIFFSAGFYRKF